MTEITINKKKDEESYRLLIASSFITFLSRKELEEFRDKIRMVLRK